MLASVLRHRSFIKPPLRYNRWNSSLSSAYADRIKAKLSQEGVGSVDELKTKLKKEGRAFEEPSPARPNISTPAGATASSTSEAGKAGPSAYKPNTSTQKRKDSSPVKPLSDFLNLSAIASKPHTVEQISALWNLYHASRSGGTGRGYLSAVVPVESYNAMMERAKRWPMFVLPLPRPTAQDSPAPSEDPNSSEQTPVEFHLIQWGMHPAPAVPSPDPDSDLFTKPSSPSPNPPISTILFTPLIQYKLHQSYAPPYLILTHYTDLAHSHGVVLLRGEITPTSSVTVGSDQAAASVDGKFMLSQTDAQLLALAVQRFYLPQVSTATQSQGAEGGNDEAVELLRTFHESPADFRWETLLKFANPTGFGGPSPTSSPSS
ncbi:hypothetical protein FRC04_001221 [Tulasnella sp. 424]|nr:hypothetical protein FRC04_001221 [Tulasnella sp. 424]KAG8969592.1 hypothetical protein FRC05_001023 [Tulasnella sp. 425]